uniref:receptor protein serine/threonine kinase n=1 Tax=Neolamprologus brichardi TaxID=32507 RepID=A0A3Q4IC75_NEOBR
MDVIFLTRVLVEPRASSAVALTARASKHHRLNIKLCWFSDSRFLPAFLGRCGVRSCAWADGMRVDELLGHHINGCWTHLHECQADRCILVTEKPSSTQKGSYRFCCCSHDLCNANYTEAPPTADTPALKPMRTDGRAEQTAVCVCAGKQKHSLSVVDVMEAANAESSIDLDNLKLLEVHTRSNCVCVCVCVCVLQGCLSHYLSLHTVDWLTCCRMTHGVTRGLAFLHTELHRGDQHKPAVAHRDLTSRNVLVRADLSCVLADFGLSMRLTGPRPCRPGDDDTMAISEVGTVRYMSPEVLGGALNLRDCESALKQVDVYALGLLYWESFRRCSDLFAGEAVPEYQLAFQAELGNHPSFEDMQSLVAREKYRPRFPEAWKENSLLLRSLKDTMEDCWDQDAEARLTAQCAEERLYELTLLSTHTAVHNHRNLSHGRWPPHGGSASPFIEDLHVGVVRNLQGDDHQASFIKTTVNGAEGGEKNRNSINYERQQAQVGTAACGAVPSVPVCLHLTEEDLEATKLDPREVDKNLRESSDENLMEHSQKQFGSESQPTDVLGVDSPPSSIHPLPKQQNLPQRPTSLHLLPKVKESGFTSSRLKLGKFKSNHRQVGLCPGSPADPQTASPSHSAGVPTLVTNGVIGGGRTNPAGPQTEDEEGTMDGGVRGGEDSRLNLLNFSPDEHEPLLSREQLPAETLASSADPPTTSDLEHKVQLSAPSGLLSSSKALSLQAPPTTHSQSEGVDTGLCFQEDSETTSTPICAQNSKGHPVRCVTLHKDAKTVQTPHICDTFFSSDDALVVDNGSLSASGEKIKRRVKTPYTLKKWRPASWVVSTDTALDPDFEFDGSSSQNHVGIPKLNQSKSSIAVFLVGGGATATTTSEPDGMTCF